mmetsp:Transcript_23828/g.51392  ORF Transcript_23828/g.51392 Transcript_23828/m.51392 type:complete len:234 (-) Transcript_23828:202-903(-)
MRAGHRLSKRSSCRAASCRASSARAASSSRRWCSARAPRSTSLPGRLRTTLASARSRCRAAQSRSPWRCSSSTSGAPRSRRRPYKCSNQAIRSICRATARSTLAWPPLRDRGRRSTRPLELSPPTSTWPAMPSTPPLASRSGKRACGWLVCTSARGCARALPRVPPSSRAAVSGEGVPSPRRPGLDRRATRAASKPGYPATWLLADSWAAWAIYVPPPPRPLLGWAQAGGGAV